MTNTNGDVFTITTTQMELKKNDNAPRASSFIPQLEKRHFLIKCLPISTVDMICMFLGELFGTTLLLLFGCMGGLNWAGTEQPAFVGPFIFGLVVMSLVQCFGTISGAHFNPAVTLCALIYRLISIPMAIAYLIAQVAGAIMGFGLFMLLTPDGIFRPEGTIGAGICSTVPRPELTTVQVFFLEYFATTVLITLCCSSWDPRNAQQQDSVAIKFGFAVSVLSMTVGPATGNSMNPARTLGPALLNGDWDLHWVYWVAPMSAALITTLIYKALFFRDAPAAKKDS
ncbi:aquaporin-4-like isoform X1 [Bradysia coprophila]|uniref:aquaporin-4-like isoform X1 n=2 Tax=Bradysia coprophila TaxID=38358 RepID=UPI00187DA311|nr:aquaporin-4-like isoform X1 [Bradysia coprophila]